MTCGGCANAVETAIRAAIPTARVTVDLAGGRVMVDPASKDAVVEKAVTEAGFTYGGTI